ncbi:MAG: hypothetical protein IJ419_10935 [Agathobacter sp.]|nr:hypothetical protein [Agathobacter sp.]
MKKVLAIIVAVVVIAALIVGIVFISNRNNDPIEPTTPNIEDTTPTEPSVESTEPEPTTPRDPNVWYLEKMEKGPSFFDIREDICERDGVDFVTIRLSTPHLSINEINDIFETNEFLKKDIKKKALRGITERWKPDGCAYYDDNGMRIYNPPLNATYDEKIVGISQDNECITVTCRTADPLFINNNVIMVECKNMPIEKYHKVLLSVLSDIFGTEIANYLIYAQDIDGEFEPVNPDTNTNNNEKYSLTESFLSEMTELKLSRTITESGDIDFKVEYIPVSETYGAVFLSDCKYQTKYNDMKIKLDDIFPNLSYFGNTNHQDNAFIDYFNINTSKNVDKSDLMFWTILHEPDVIENEKLGYCFAVTEDNEQTANPDVLNVWAMATYDKSSNLESLSLITRGWTSVEITDKTTQEQAIQKAIEIAQQQIKFIYNIDITINNAEGLVTGETIDYSHALTEKTMQLKPKWTIEVQSDVVFISWDITVNTVD